jgi:hypothetical protein
VGRRESNQEIYLMNDERRVIRNQDLYLEHVHDMNRERSIEQNKEATGESRSPPLVPRLTLLRQRKKEMKRRAREELPGKFRP